MTGITCNQQSAYSLQPYAAHAFILRVSVKMR